MLKVPSHTFGVVCCGIGAGFLWSWGKCLEASRGGNRSLGPEGQAGVSPEGAPPLFQEAVNLTGNVLWGGVGVGRPAVQMGAGTRFGGDFPVVAAGDVLKVVVRGHPLSPARLEPSPMSTFSSEGINIFPKLLSPEWQK